MVYHYDDDRNSTIETDGKTYIRKIPLFNISNIRRVSVYITINNIVHPQSKPVTIERCAPQNITTTSMYVAECMYMCNMQLLLINQLQ